jgi:hypothetical protein
MADLKLVIGALLLVLCAKEIQAHQRCNTIPAQSNGLGNRPSPQKKPSRPMHGASEKGLEATGRKGYW